ncbi:cysteine desulfurase family protein [Bdellovibrio sp. HCB2-146]|uniref:cysteine desulfurase family protein n=1 Tax=Bdellovibrio sp. HCB2-146 TaxID=3394362 RepID=UPI0039BC9525
MDLQLSAEKSIKAAAAVYLDYNATTPLDPEVYRLMEPYFKEYFGNPSSASHQWGWNAENAVQKARMQVAGFIGSKASEITFTSGATEANNWAIFGLITKLRETNPQEPLHFITSNVEHSSIMKAMMAAQKMGVEVDFLPVNSLGQIEVEHVARAIKPHTRLMSFIWVNNEIGSINPIPELAKLAKEKNIYFHTDATQAVGKIPVHATNMGIDLMSFSGHKIYGPKGVGALYIRSANPKVEINPLIYGGGQEKGLRSGTLNVPAIVGLGACCEYGVKHLETENARLTEMREAFWNRLQFTFSDIRLNGHPSERSPINLNVTLPGCRSEELIPRLKKVGISTGSACSSGSMSMSHVLKGIGLTPEQAACTLRISIGRWTTEEELHQALEALKTAVAGLNT